MNDIILGRRGVFREITKEEIEVALEHYFDNGGEITQYPEQKSYYVDYVSQQSGNRSHLRG